jgi:glycosyltransferase involved in cell wall biosynthesis
MPDLEVVVAIERGDDASIAALQAIRDARVSHVVNPEKRGPGAARDFGVSCSRGQWVAFLDDDDEWHPEKLGKQLAVVSDGEKTIVMTLSRVVTASGAFINPTEAYAGERPIDEWLFGRRTWTKGGESMLQTSSLMMPRTLFQKLCFGQSRHEEWELAIRAVKQLGYKLVTVPEPLVTYQMSSTVYAWRHSAEWVEGVRDILTPQAYSGFCLTVAPKGIVSPDRNSAFLTFLWMGLKNGRPTAKQLFAFAFFWLVPDKLRHRLRARSVPASHDLTG